MFLGSITGIGISLLYLLFLSTKDENRKIQQENIPQSKTLQVLPFWMPLFYPVTVSGLFYRDLHFDNLLLETLIAINSLLFLEWQQIHELNSGLLERNFSILLASVPRCFAAGIFARNFYIDFDLHDFPHCQAFFPVQGFRRMIILN